MPIRHAPPGYSDRPAPVSCNHCRTALRVHIHKKTQTVLLLYCPECDQPLSSATILHRQDPTVIIKPTALQRHYLLKLKTPPDPDLPPAA